MGFVETITKKVKEFVGKAEDVITGTIKEEEKKSFIGKIGAILAFGAKKYNGLFDFLEDRGIIMCDHIKHEPSRKLIKRMVHNMLTVTKYLGQAFVVVFIMKSIIALLSSALWALVAVAVVYSIMYASWAIWGVKEVESPA